MLGTIAKNPLLLKKESDGKVSFTLATATIDKEASVAPRPQSNSLILMRVQAALA
ncbi:hypothetical protein BSPWISOXPB_7366 [uncultured Gammaproteobacteria bacterium]|nr:hypothetical protein BSPWISOXPB_740 [uncultured Gammaproteobacteria bacterium]VVM24994.1 hypothetical protein BSPWISOXPB_7366 [uncultured Gammaproteobacteria bacterium]